MEWWVESAVEWSVDGRTGRRMSLILGFSWKPEGLPRRKEDERNPETDKTANREANRQTSTEAALRPATSGLNSWSAGQPPLLVCVPSKDAASEIKKRCQAEPLSLFIHRGQRFIKAHQVQPWAKRGEKPQIARLLKLQSLDFKTALINMLKQRWGI